MKRPRNHQSEGISFESLNKETLNWRQFKDITVYPVQVFDEKQLVLADAIRQAREAHISITIIASNNPKFLSPEQVTSYRNFCVALGSMGLVPNYVSACIYALWPANQHNCQVFDYIDTKTGMIYRFPVNFLDFIKALNKTDSVDIRTAMQTLLSTAEYDFKEILKRIGFISSEKTRLLAETIEVRNNYIKLYNGEEANDKENGIGFILYIGNKNLIPPARTKEGQKAWDPLSGQPITSIRIVLKQSIAEIIVQMYEMFSAFNSASASFKNRALIPFTENIVIYSVFEALKNDLTVEQLVPKDADTPVTFWLTKIILSSILESDDFSVSTLERALGYLSEDNMQLLTQQIVDFENKRLGVRNISGLFRKMSQ